jgi:hypothetical protein
MRHDGHASFTQDANRNREQRLSAARPCTASMETRFDKTGLPV